MVTEKIQRLAKQAQDALSLIYGSTAVVEKRDTNRDLYFEVTKVGAASPFASVRFKTWDATTPDKLDGIGIAQRVYEPHTVQVGFDVGAKATDTITLTSAVATQTITINGVVFTAMAGAAGANQFTVAGTDAQDATALANAINSSVTAGVAGVVTASAVNNVVTITAVQPGLGGNAITVVSSDASMVVATARLTGGTASLCTDGDKMNVLAESIKAGVETMLYEKGGLTYADLGVDANFVGVYRNREYPTQQV